MAQITTQRLFFRPLESADITQIYVDWLNDPEVNRYLEVRLSKHSLESCSRFVEAMNAATDQNLFGIFLSDSKRHIGNIKLGFVSSYHARAQLSLFIGDKTCWRKGLATESIGAITIWGFEQLKLMKIEAGCYEQNLASLRAFLKAGYQVEGFFRRSFILDHKRVGGFWMGILPGEVLRGL
jgi:ribosomal-protein-alanine N-acetyltransferase